MRFLLVRHGQTDAVGRMLAGRGGPGLNAAGAAQAERIATGPVNGVFTSPQLRARETAARIAAAADCAVQIVPGLDEIDFGAWTGHAFDALTDAPGWGRWNSLRSFSAAPGGESMLQVQARGVAVLQSLHGRRTGETVVLVSHADVIRCVLAYALGMPIDLMQRIEIAPASVSIVALDDAEVRIEGINLK